LNNGTNYLILENSVQGNRKIVEEDNQTISKEVSFKTAKLCQIFFFSFELVNCG
jgi:hypothetical protein